MLSAIYSFMILTASVIASDDVDSKVLEIISIYDDDEYIDNCIPISANSDSSSTLVPSDKTNSHESKHETSNNARRTFSVNQVFINSSDHDDLTNEYESTNSNTTLGGDVQRFIHGNSSACANLASVKLAARQSPNLETFVDSFCKDVLAVPALQNFLKLQIPAAETRDVFYKLDYQVLKEYGYPEPVAGEISQAAGSYDFFTLPAYFRAVGYTIGKFLASERIEVGPDVSQCYADFVENTLSSSNVSSVEELIQALLDAFVNFIKAFGFDFGEKMGLLSQLFTIELITFVNII